MTDRKKLIELLGDYFDIGDCTPEDIADHLTSHGVRLETKQAISDKTSDSKWISVEDEKPKSRGEYFITYKFAGSDMQFYGSAFWHDDIPDNGYVKGDHFSNEGVGGMHVTHWMKIPKPPQPPREE